ncbi:MAG: hypothetical protein PWR06_2854 [Thermoanaerobacteraceae bacterium]|nr:hypothetical protein [Thermoanaerobacteraceae bacterium]MDN5301845.1 hypothetical protein [Thermoanaerobacteraceae bacterium]
MHRNRKSIFIALLMAFVLIIPGIASATTWYNIRFTVNGQTQTIQVPIDNNGTVSFTKTYRYVYTYKDGKWVLSSENGQSGGKTIPPAPQPPKVTPPSDSGSKKPVEAPKQPSIKELTADEQKMLDLVNAERKKAGVEPLKIDMRLVEISRKKSQDMIDKHYFGHTSPTYGTPFDALKANGVSFRYAGENLAGAPNVEEAHKALMASPGHRANILNPNYNYIGIGIVDGGPYGKMYTQTFIGTK